MTPTPSTTLQIRSLVSRKSGELELSLADTPLPAPAADEVMVRIEAAPMNPSDLGLLFGAADMRTAKASGTASRPVVTADIPEAAMKAWPAAWTSRCRSATKARAWSSRPAPRPKRRRCSARRWPCSAARCTRSTAASPPPSAWRCPKARRRPRARRAFVNPLTALGMVETMRREGHKALVHTAAASNLGQMLNRICLKDGIALVNIVRKKEQEDLLRGLGAKHVCNASVAHLHAGPHRCPGRHRRHARLRRHRRRQAGRRRS